MKINLKYSVIARHDVFLMILRHKLSGRVEVATALIVLTLHFCTFLRDLIFLLLFNIEGGVFSRDIVKNMTTLLKQQRQVEFNIKFFDLCFYIFN